MGAPWNLRECKHSDERQRNLSRCRDDAGRRDTGLVTKLCVYVSSKLCGQLCMHCVQSPVSSQQVSSSIFFISALDYQRTSTAAPQIVRRVVQPAEQLAVQPVVQSFSLRAICFASTRYAAFFTTGWMYVCTE